MPDIRSTTVGVQEFELEDIERQAAQLTRAWAARLLGELDAATDLADAAQRAEQVGHVLRSLGQTFESVRLARSVLG